MEKTFREYHKFSDEEFDRLLKSCLFVFDTNTLLNMYRYGRETVDAYIGVLEEIKTKKQLWIPHQVGFEFYENRINVIFQFEKSYDEILSIIERPRSEIQQKYKNHPFLDLDSIGNEMNSLLSPVVAKIKAKKEEHPKWMEKDDVLEKINKIFEGNVGNSYDEKRLEDIKNEGKNRYENKIPPGFEDSSKPDDKKFGDLVIWNQIIDKAKVLNKPIVLISGDVKKDWWLEKEGKKIMPLPQLKKEMLDKAGVDFHMYTADNFLEEYSSIRAIDKKVIIEVRKIREAEEAKNERYGAMEKLRVILRLRTNLPNTILQQLSECCDSNEGQHEVYFRVEDKRGPRFIKSRYNISLSNEIYNKLESILGIGTVKIEEIEEESCSL